MNDGIFSAPLNYEGLRLDEAVKTFTRRFLMLTLKNCQGNQCKAAGVLGVHRNTVTRLMDDLNIPRKRAVRS
jgi:DNA-binding NtrC family response regulator